MPRCPDGATEHPSADHVPPRSHRCSYTLRDDSSTVCCVYDRDLHNKPTVVRSRPRATAYQTVRRVDALHAAEEDDDADEYVAGDVRRPLGPTVLSDDAETLYAELDAVRPMATKMHAPVPPNAACVRRELGGAEDGGVVLRDHQVAVARQIVTQRGLIVSAGVGTGKTLLAVACMGCARQYLRPKGFVVLTPAPLVSNFRNTIARFDPTLLADTEIVTYGALVRRFGALAHAKDKRPFVRTLSAEFGGKFVVMDEVHANAGVVRVSKRTGRVEHVQAYICVSAASFATRTLGLTATPMVNGAIDVANLASIARGDGVCLSNRGFDVVIADPQLRRTFFGSSFYFHEDRRDRSDFPEERLAPRSKCEIVLANEDLRQYEQFEAHHPTLMTGTFEGKDTEAFYNGIRRFANTLNALKAQRVVDILLSLPSTQRRAIVTSQFIEYGVLPLQAALSKAGIPFVTLTGKSTETQRRHAVDTFAAEEVSVLLLSTAGVQGLDFKGVRTVILTEPFWNRALRTQAVGRAVRFRSHAHLPPAQRHVTVYDLCLVKDASAARTGASHTVDEIVADIAAQKEETMRVMRKLLI